MSKQAKSIISLTVIGLYFVILFTSITQDVYAQNKIRDPRNNPTYSGLVQCDGVVTDPSKQKRCDFAALVDQIQFLMNWFIYISIPIAIGLFAYAGGLYMWAGATGDEKSTGKAKGIFSNVAWGLFWMLAAWMIVRTILNWVADPSFGLDLLSK